MKKVYAIRQSISWGDDVSVVPPQDVVYSTLDKAKAELNQRFTTLVEYCEKLAADPVRSNWSGCKQRFVVGCGETLAVVRIVECEVV